MELDKFSFSFTNNILEEWIVIFLFWFYNVCVFLKGERNVFVSI